MISRLLIANRGEIACRIIRTAQQMGITAIAIYSSADQQALHIKLADEAYFVGEPPSSVSYLNQDSILKIAKKYDIDAIHPGYGFLAENHEFASSCEQQGIIFIGPNSKIIELMGDKSEAKKFLQKNDIPLVPGYSGPQQSFNFLNDYANQMGYPVIIKPALGGGGKGMHVVNHSNDFIECLTLAKREAIASFGNDKVILEKLITCPKHIEVQIFSDQQNNHIHLFGRDCSIQRRHQKVIEEAPFHSISKKTEEKIYSTAINIAQLIDYVGAGTIEFLIDNHENYYFIEMNTRLQVEHAVTEMITNVDLIKWQLMVASHKPLPVKQEDIKLHGCAIEARIYAEDPDNQFLPSIGQLLVCEFPQDDDLTRIETGIRQGDIISQYYDPLLAKVICHGETRESATNRLLQALRQCYISGISTNLEYLQRIIKHESFIHKNTNINFLATNELTPLANINQYELLSYASIYLFIQNQTPVSPNLRGWRLNQARKINYQFILENKCWDCSLIPNHEAFTIIIDEFTNQYQANLHEHQLTIMGITQSLHMRVTAHNDFITIWLAGKKYTLQQYSRTVENEFNEITTKIVSPMPGTIIQVFAKNNDTVAIGDKLLIIEAMKMQHTLYAEHAGIVSNLTCEVGQFVKENTELLKLI